MKKINVKNTDYQMKLVPGFSSEGLLDPQAKKELEDSIQQTDTGDFGSEVNQDVNAADIRATMGWKKANHKNKNILKIENTELDNIKVRIYVQEKLVDAELPVILFMHGGGFFGGSLDNVEFPCRELADCGQVRVISIDYGLAPEHPYPQNLLDCYQVLNYVGQHKNQLHVKSITAMGDSAGGNLTYTLSLLDRQLGTNYIDKAVALYPVTYQGNNVQLRKMFDDPEPIIANEIPSEIKTYINNFNDSQGLINSWYIKDSDPESIYISPLNASEEMLKKLPKTLFMVGEFDPLRLQGEAFYNKAKLAGCDITYLRYNGMIHAFMDKVGDFAQADDALKETINFICC
ncbi:lipolytic protein [Companilactobacillus nantensis DSM 16982]|uniref:Lipolytic protein n=2 Tax=Companilactobacillus nantensis TaxID=305793 RepID=A0A0R1WUE6_9LACO|nr:lipolytic protein [Companilactobacillus nantensis DSM 16982]